MITIGIDPGVNGGMAVRGFADETTVSLFPFHHFDCLDGLRAMVGSRSEIHAYLELVAGSPVQSPKTAFTFGENFGWWWGTLNALGVGYTFVRPTVWQKPYRADLQAILNKGMPPAEAYRARKNFFKDRAQELYPNLKITLAVADAVLLMHYGLTA